MSSVVMSSEVGASSMNNWLPETEEVYLRLKAQADEGGWMQVRHSDVDPPHQFPGYVYSRVATDNGPVIHQAFFVQKEERKLHGVCQFGAEAQGPRGFAHGGATSTVHDSITGVLSGHVVSKMVATASLTVNFKKPTPLRTAILMEAHIDKIEGRKIFLTSRLKSPDSTIIYSESAALYINLENRLRDFKADSSFATER